MLRFATYPLNDDEIAVLYREGADVLIIMNEKVTDSRTRCEAVNNLLAGLRTSAAA